MQVPCEAEIVFENQVITNIESYADAYANFLVSFGITVQSSLAIFLDRSPECIFVMLAAIKIGVPFLPIDTCLPYERVCFMLQDSEVKYIITSKKYEQRFEGYCLIRVESIIKDYTRYISLQPKNEIIYMLYTSGSTGIPKGIEIRRESFFAFIRGVSKVIDFSHNKRIACFTTVSFDIFFLESIMALYKGLTVVLALQNESVNPRLMAQMITNNNIDMVQMTPSRIQLLTAYDLDCLSNVSEILVGGETISDKLLSVLQTKTHAKIYNMYGPTETTIWSTISELTNKKRVDIGTPIEGTNIYIVDEMLNIVPEGVVGEICIGGVGLAKGYINNQQLTEEKFIKLPLPTQEEVFRTGDLGKFESGVYIYCGRKDNQVKIRGYRVELEEIECAITQIDAVNQAVVLLIMQENRKMLLAAYTGKNKIDEKYFIEHLKKNLPDYMIPSIYIRLDTIPQTGNGKVNRSQIIESYNRLYEIKKRSGYVKMDNDLQGQEVADSVIRVIGKHIGYDTEITMKSSFISLGMDSISFIKIIVDLEEKFGFEFDVENIILSAYPDVKTLISYIEAKAVR